MLGVEGCKSMLIVREKNKNHPLPPEILQSQVSPVVDNTRIRQDHINGFYSTYLSKG